MHFVVTDTVLQLVLRVVLVWDFISHLLIRVLFFRLVYLRLTVKFLLLSQMKWSVTGLSGEGVLRGEVYSAERLGWASCYTWHHSTGRYLLLLILHTPLITPANLASLCGCHSLLNR